MDRKAALGNRNYYRREKMKLRLKWVSAIGIVLIALTSCNGPANEPKSRSMLQDSVPYDSLRVVLEAIYDTDQGIRGKLMASEGEEFGKRSEEHTSELQSLMRNSYAVLCLKKHKL